jgi:hypothetical protein
MQVNVAGSIATILAATPRWTPKSSIAADGERMSLAAIWVRFPEAKRFRSIGRSLTPSNAAH